MQYLGGKSKWGRKIVEAIEPWRLPGSIFVDAFCGTLNVVRWARTPRLALDLCQPLITTLQAVQRGWEPPEHVTPETYARIKARPDPWHPLTAFAMFGCSWGGMWDSQYRAPVPGKFEHRYAKNQLLAKVAACSDTLIRCLDYRSIPAPPPGTVMYADKPYEATATYAGVPPFNDSEFWTWADWWHRCGALVFVSEGSAAKPPKLWIHLKTWTMPTYLNGKGTGEPREERLYVHRESPMARNLTHV